MEVIEKLKEDPRPRWIEKLKGIKKGEYYRTSWGNYRIIYSIEDDILLVTVSDIDGHDQSYRNLNKKLM